MTDAPAARACSAESVGAAIDAFLYSTPQLGEPAYAFVYRCSAVIAEDEARSLFVRAMIETLGEAGIAMNAAAATAQSFVLAMPD